MNAIKFLRNKFGWTQDDLGKRLNVKGSAISKYESESIPITSDTLRKLAEIFNVTTDFILGISNDINHPNTLFHPTVYSAKEESIIKKYRALDERGKQTVDETLEREYKFANPLKAEKDAG